MLTCVVTSGGPLHAACISQPMSGEVAAELLLLGPWAPMGPHMKRRNAEFQKVRDTDLRCCTSSRGCTDVRASGGK